MLWLRCLEHTAINTTQNHETEGFLQNWIFARLHVVIQLSNGVTSTATKSNGDQHCLPATALDVIPRTAAWISRTTTPTNELHFTFLQFATWQRRHSRCKSVCSTWDKKKTTKNNHNKTATHSLGCALQKHLSYFNHIFKLSQLLSVTKECHRSTLKVHWRAFSFKLLSLFKKIYLATLAFYHN